MLIYLFYGAILYSGMSLVNINNTHFSIIHLHSNISAFDEFHWVIVTIALIVFIAALALSIFFLLKSRMVSVSSDYDAIKMVQPDEKNIENPLISPDMEDTVQKIEIGSKLPSIPDIIDLQIVPDSVNQGDDVRITFKVNNNSAENVTYKPDLRINGKIKQSDSVSLPPGAVMKITFVVNTSTTGIFHVELDGLEGEFRVLPSNIQKLF